MQIFRKAFFFVDVVPFFLLFSVKRGRATSLRRVIFVVVFSIWLLASTKALPKPLIYYDNFPFTSETFGTSANLILFRNTCQYFDQSFRIIKCDVERFFAEIKTKSVNIQIKCIFRLRVVVLLWKCQKKSQMGQVGSVYETCQ